MKKVRRLLPVWPTISRTPIVLGLLIGACSDQDEGIQVGVEVSHRQTPEEPAGALEDAEIQSDLGYQIRMTRAFVTLSTIELESCVEGEHARLLRRVFTFVPSAHAHIDETPTRLGTPTVMNLSETEAHAMGTLEPPPAEYCGVHVTLGPADEDAQGLAEGVPMLGKTILVEGTYAMGSGAPQAFSLSSSDSMEVEADADGAGSVLPMDLTAADSNVTLSVELTYGTWFDGVHFSTSEESVQADIMLQNMGTSLLLQKKVGR